MRKEEIAALLERSLSYPGTEKSGEHLLELVLKDARRLVHNDRIEFIEVIREWLSRTEEPYISLALRVARELRLHELRPDIARLRDDIVRGLRLSDHYLYFVDRARDDLM